MTTPPAPSSPATSPAPALGDQAFLDAFMACQLTPADFDHTGHLRIAWLLLQRHALADAVALTCQGIARLAAHLGVPGKYHHTLTEALVRLMAHGGAATLAWPDFLAANPRLVHDAPGLLAMHWSPQALAQPEARAHFVPPDRLPLPAPSDDPHR